MTAPTNGHSRRPYRVIVSEHLRQRILAGLANALHAGTASAYRAAFRRIGGLAPLRPVDLR